MGKEISMQDPTANQAVYWIWKSMNRAKEDLLDPSIVNTVKGPYHIMALVEGQEFLEDLQEQQPTVEAMLEIDREIEKVHRLILARIHTPYTNAGEGNDPLFDWIDINHENHEDDGLSGIGVIEL
jgi:hypothetical protein